VSLADASDPYVLLIAQASNNTRTFWYTGLEVFVLLALTGVQVVTLTRFFSGKNAGLIRITV